MSSKNKKYGLGRGLEALLGDDDIDLNLSNTPSSLDSLIENTVFKSDSGREIAIDQIEPCQYQPRTEFDEEALQSLCSSIKEKGILQPLLLRKKGNKYEIVAGERRWRAAKMAGLNMVPAIIKELNDQEALEIALIENLQRENLTAIEEAEGLNRLMLQYNYTQEVLSKVIGKSRSYIANTLRLLSLPESVKAALKDGKISAGHARALIGSGRPEDLAKQIINENLTVRQVELLAAKIKNKSPKIRAPRELDADLKRIIDDLHNRLKLKVKINAGKSGKGSVVLHYNNPAELSSILDLLEQR